MGADYPNKKLAEKQVPRAEGHEGHLKDSGIEGRGPEAETIRAETRGNKKGAGMVGDTNVNVA